MFLPVLFLSVSHQKHGRILQNSKNFLEFMQNCVANRRFACLYLLGCLFTAHSPANLAARKQLVGSGRAKAVARKGLPETAIRKRLLNAVPMPTLTGQAKTRILVVATLQTSVFPASCAVQHSTATGKKPKMQNTQTHSTTGVSRLRRAGGRRLRHSGASCPLGNLRACDFIQPRAGSAG